MYWIRKSPAFYLNPSKKPFGQCQAVFLGAGLDLTSSGLRGSSGSPRAILKALDQIELEPSLSSRQLDGVIDIFNEGILELKKKHKGKKQMIQASNDFLDEIQRVSSHAVKNKKFFFCFGGEHLISLGIARGIAENIDPKDVTFIVFDSHLDMRNEFDGFSLDHATWLNKTIRLGFAPLVIGVRDMISFEEQDFIKERKLQESIFPCGLQPKKYYSELFRRTKCDWLLKENFIFDSAVDKKLLNKILSGIKTKHVFISIDIDVLSGNIFTGTPMPLGISFKTLQELLFEILLFLEKKNKILLGFDINEVIPGAGSGNASTETMAGVLSMNLLYWNFKKMF